MIAFQMILPCCHMAATMVNRLIDGMTCTTFTQVVPMLSSKSNVHALNVQLKVPTPTETVHVSLDTAKYKTFHVLYFSGHD